MYRFLFLLTLFYLTNSCYCKDRFLIGAYYFDGWSGRQKELSYWSDNAPTHLNSKLKLKYPEREPIWGWRDDSLSIMEKQIDLASENGVDFFMFCWYFDENQKDFNEEVVENNPLHTSLNLFLKAKNKNKMNFSILICNHTGHKIWGKNNWIKVIEYLNENYLSDNQYLRIDDKPVIGFFDANATAFYLDAINERLIELSGNSIFSISCNNRSNKFSAFTWYSLHESGTYFQLKDYGDLINYAETKWNDNKGENVIPLVMSGWDNRPWHGIEKSVYYINRMPELFQKHIEDALLFNLNNNSKSNIVLIYAWNELGEGGYIIPTLGDVNYNYLRAVNRALNNFF